MYVIFTFRNIHTGEERKEIIKTRFYNVENALHEAVQSTTWDEKNEYLVETLIR